MRVVPVPPILDVEGLDHLIGAANDVDAGKVLLDARHLRWVDPLGMIGLLGVGRVLGERCRDAPLLQMGDGGEVSGYLARMGFFREAGEAFGIDASPPSRGQGASDVLLELTTISANDDIHTLVDRVQRRAGKILSRSLHYPQTAVVQFSVILSEVCQNILEHADAPGWVAAQVYNWTRRLGRSVLVLGVGDLGRGFRGSLQDQHAARYGDRWSDAAALEAAFLHGTTRFPDSGRGQGIQQIRKQVRRWGGAISIRSGAARIADVPEWYDRAPLETDLPPFPGAQIHIVLPARVVDGE